MKCFSKFQRHLILYFSLMVTSVSPTFVLAQTDPLLDQQKKDCAKTSATIWSENLNKCISTASSQNDRHEADDCNAIASIPQREACHKALAEKNSKLSSDPNKLYQGSYDKSMTINGAYTLVAAINMMGAKKGKSSCTSKTIFAASAIVGIATDLYLKSEAKKKVEALNGKFKLDVTNSASDSQIKALEYLKEEQKTVSEIAGLEKNRNLILVIGYGAAGVVAGYELATTGTNPDCAKSEKADTKADGAPAGGAPAGGTTAGPVDSSTTSAEGTVESASLNAADSSAMSTVTNLTGGSIGILVMSTIGAIYSYKLYTAAEKQQADALANMKKLDQLIKTFKDSYANFCPKGRESLAEPKCYCYTSDGKENPNRTKSQTCIDLFAKDKYKIDAVAGDYSGPPQALDPVGCVNLNGQFDEKCGCKKLLDSKGGNACMKTSNISIPAGLGANFGKNSGINDITAMSNSAANGNSGLVLNGANNLASKAIMSRKLAEEIFKKLAPELPANVAALTNMNEKNVGQYARAVFGAKAMRDAANGSPSAIGLATGRSSDPKISAILKEAEFKAGLDLVGSGKGLMNKKGDGKDAQVFSFVGDNSANGSQTQTSLDGQKTYNYKNNDISKKDDNSIFDIISNRYIQSGLKRLFDN